MSSQETYQKMLAHAQETATFGSMGAVLGWDQQVMMPPKGIQHRANQFAALSGFLHDRATSPQVGEWLAELSESDLAKDPHSVEGANIREWKRSYDRATKLPKELVVEFARVTSLADHDWQQARAESNYALFKPSLQKILSLVREVADYIGYEGERYNALLDEYEPGMTAKEVEQLFAPLRERTPALVQQIVNSPKQPDTSILHRHFPREAQERFVKMVVEMLGFDFEAGRLDPTTHPFASRIAPGDTRITTRYYEDFFNPAFFGSVHEVGHGLYEMGLLEEHFGTPMGEAVSLGIHESQSRMWENFVARSRSFWEFFLPKAQDHFDALKGVALDDFVFAANEVCPSTIRVEADEITYNLHIMLRFELELAMLRGDLEVDDLPDAWNEKFAHYMGFAPPNDAEGVLQDVHWSSGLIGYFPTYSLGNLYAAQLFEAARRDLGDLDEQFRQGEFKPLLGWLRENIHQHGSRYTPKELAERITGKPVSAEPLLNYFERKFVPLYSAG